MEMTNVTLLNQTMLGCTVHYDMDFLKVYSIFFQLKYSSFHFFKKQDFLILLIKIFLNGFRPFCSGVLEWQLS